MAGHGDYVTFQFVAPNNSYGFKTYNDATGRGLGFMEGKDKDGMPIYRRWKFDRDVRKISVHKDKTDLSTDKLNAVEFLRNSPDCKGSPNGTYLTDGTQVNVMYEEVNEEKAANVSLDFEKFRIEAQNKALNVKGQDFIDLCALIGVIQKTETIMRFSLVDFAKNKPQSFMDLYNDPIRQLRSVIRRAVHTGIFNKEHNRLSWENELIGVDEDDAVHKLKSNENLLKAVKAQLEKLK